MYDVKLPENAVLHPAAVERIVANARARGLSNDEAQANIELANTEAAAAGAAALAAQKDQWAKDVSEWEKQTLADVALGKTKAERQAALERGMSVIHKFAEADPEGADGLLEYLDASGLNKHPQVNRLFAWLGKSASEGTFVQAGAGSGGGGSTDARAFFPKSEMNP